MLKERNAAKIELSGIVQGVGFRPFVYQAARRHHLCGEVVNTAAGVSIHAEGSAGDLTAFCRALTEKAPPLARIVDMAVHPAPVRGYGAFSIGQSRSRAERTVLIAPDTAVCEDCRRELFNPADRRYRYPFINCTHCGPRYTIIENVPYDRPFTAMKDFVMCPQCQKEYDDPASRRFHAQPNACAVCGPQVSLCGFRGHRLPVADPIRYSIELLKKGCILAVKGLGGFHLAVDASGDASVRRLRRRKRREERPFAVMARDLAQIRRFAHVDTEEEALLKSTERPIVLLAKRAPDLLAPSVAPGNGCFGVMLPYTPLHYLLMEGGFAALVMTSGNLSEEPIAIDNDEAFDRLGGVADFFLIHNRDIYLRSDDSIVRHTAGRTRLVRRSRGYVPVPVFLKNQVPTVLGCGAELKNTVCLTRERQAFLSQHVGDLENPAADAFYRRTVAHLQRILDVKPRFAAHDLHPDYLSTRYAFERRDLQPVAVQHHHAHIVSCMAEHHLTGPVIGLAFDGTGYGSDGCIWGGEILTAHLDRFCRTAHLEYVPMPGGAAAVKEPWRMAVSYLWSTFGPDWEGFMPPALARVDVQKRRIIQQMTAQRVNAPLTSSLGRLFDGIAAMAGLRLAVGFEGQAAMALEMCAAPPAGDGYPYEWSSEVPHRIAVGPLIRGVVTDLLNRVPVRLVSARFHETLIRLCSDLCGFLRRTSGLNQIVLSGGVFQNAVLLKGLMESLAKKGFEVYSHRQVPTNDGGIALGQAVSAAARLARGTDMDTAAAAVETENA